MAFRGIAEFADSSDSAEELLFILSQHYQQTQGILYKVVIIKSVLISSSLFPSSTQKSIYFNYIMSII